MVINYTNIIKTNNHLSPKESLNSDSQHFQENQPSMTLKSRKPTMTCQLQPV
jgi:hypothetical protein